MVAAPLLCRSEVVVHAVPVPVFGGWFHPVPPALGGAGIAIEMVVQAVDISRHSVGRQSGGRHKAVPPVEPSAPVIVRARKYLLGLERVEVRVELAAGIASLQPQEDVRPVHLCLIAASGRGPSESTVNGGRLIGNATSHPTRLIEAVCLARIKNRDRKYLCGVVSCKVNTGDQRILEFREFVVGSGKRVTVEVEVQSVDAVLGP